MTEQIIRQHRNIWLIDKPNYRDVPVVTLRQAAAMVRYYWGDGTPIRVIYRNRLQRWLHRRQEKTL